MLLWVESAVVKGRGQVSDSKMATPHSSFPIIYQEQQQQPPPPPQTSYISRAFSRQSDMAPGDMLQRMAHFNERSTSVPSDFLNPVELSHKYNQSGDQSLSPSVSETLKRSHWKSTSKADKCFDSKCSQKLSLLSRKRNCCMCGEVFCYKCTSFRLKLSPDATPDPTLGTPCHVCHACFNTEVDDIGNEYNWTQYFSTARHHSISSLRQKEEESLSMPIPSLTTPAGRKMKRDRVQQEINRLTIGFSGSYSWIKSLISIPSWQKNLQWVEPRKSHQCLNCHNSFKKLAKKVNCRVCGQVYCSSCTKGELVIFLQTSSCPTPQWAINGKEGTPKSAPHAVVLLPICITCERELEEILIDEIESSAVEEEEEEEQDFMDTLCQLQSTLYRLKSRIEIWLPQYQKLVDSMEVVERQSKPVTDLARSQSNLSDQFSQMVVESQKLRRLEPLTPTQAKVLKNITIATYSFYSNSMYLFRVSKQKLGECMPVESMELIQDAVNQISFERVHIFVRQITFEAMHLELSYKLTGQTFTQQLVDCTEVMEEEGELYFAKFRKDWDKHLKDVKRLVQEDFQGTNPTGEKRRRLKLPKNIKKKPHYRIIVQYKIISQSLKYLKKSSQELGLKTSDSVFVRTKETLCSVCDGFEKQKIKLQRDNPQAFIKEVKK